VHYNISLESFEIFCIYTAQRRSSKVAAVERQTNEKIFIKQRNIEIIILDDNDNNK